MTVPFYVEQFARRLHEEFKHHLLAPDWPSLKGAKLVAWEDLPERQRAAMIDSVDQAIRAFSRRGPVAGESRLGISLFFDFPKGGEEGLEVDDG